MKLSQIKPNPSNPRIIRDDKFNKLVKSIQQFPAMMEKRPIVVDDTMTVLGGNMRLRALQHIYGKSGDIPDNWVTIAQGWTEEQKREFVIKDNAAFGEWDWEALANEWNADDLTDWGIDIPFPEDATEIPTGEVKEDGFDPEQPVETVCNKGDIWKLGDHRLMCGDSTDSGSVALLMDGERADMCFTDPPYGVAVGSRNKVLNEHNGTHSIERDIINDTLPPEELHELLTKAMANCRENSKDDASYYVTSPQGGDLGMMMMMKDAGLPVRHMLVWVKNAAVFSMGRLDYDYRHEPILYTWTKSHHFYGGYQNSVFEDELDIDKLKKDELVSLLKDILSEKRPTSVIKENNPLKNDLHPTMKPVALVARFMINNTRAGQSVIDLFGGSGTTMIAAEQLNRRCYMMELDPHYCDVIIARWEKFTGRKAEKITEGMDV